MYTTDTREDIRPASSVGTLCCESLPRHHGNRTPEADELERKSPQSYRKYCGLAFHHRRYRLSATCGWFAKVLSSKIAREDQALTDGVGVSWKGTTALSCLPNLRLTADQKFSVVRIPGPGPAAFLSKSGPLYIIPLRVEAGTTPTVSNLPLLPGQITYINDGVKVYPKLDLLFIIL